MEYFVVIGLVSGIVGFVVVWLSVLLANILPSKIPIGALVVVAINGASLISCIFITLMDWWSLDTSTFYYKPQRYYVGFFMYFLVPAIAYGSITGLLTYLGARVWQNRVWKGHDKRFLLPLGIAISISLVSLSWILLTLGLVAANFMAAMSKG